MSGVYDISGAIIERTKTIQYKSYSIVLDRTEIGKGATNVEIVLLDASGNYIKSIGLPLTDTNYNSVIKESELSNLVNQHIINQSNTL
jgi:hypothetical protein